MRTREFVLFGAVTMGAAGCYSSFAPSGPAGRDAGVAFDASGIDAGRAFDAGPRSDAAGIDSGTGRDAAAIDAPPVSPFTGSYEGTYMGGEGGELFVEIRPDGTLTLEIHGPRGVELHEGTIRVDGSLNADGRIGSLRVSFSGHFTGPPGSHTGMGVWRIEGSDGEGTWEIHQVA